MAKILSLNKLIKELAPLRDKKRIGLVTGCFDILHKEERATKTGSKLLKCRKRKANSTTNIVNKVIKADL